MSNRPQRKQPYSIPHRGPRWLLAVAVLTVVAAVGIVVLRPEIHPDLAPAPVREHREEAGSAGGHGETELAPQLPPPSAAPEVAPTPAPLRSLRLVAKLSLDPSEDFQPTSVRVATLRIDPSDRADFIAQRAAGGAGAGPTRIEELANPHEWLEPVVTATREEASIEVMDCPEAFGYRLIAWQSNGRFFFFDFFPGEIPPDGVLDAGTINGEDPTGIELRLENNLHDENEFLVRIIRQPSDATADDDSRPLAILRHLDPALHETLSDGDWLPVPAGRATRIGPLATDPEVHLAVSTLAGIEGRDVVPVKLRRGSFVPAKIDLALQFPDSVDTVDIFGRVLYGKTEVPVEGAVVRLMDLPASQQQTTSSNGAYEFISLPRSSAARVEVLVPRSADGRPLARELTEFTIGPFHPEDFPEDRVEHDMRLESYRWLIAEIPPEVRAALAARARFPFPIHVLQQLVDDDNWVDLPADEFISEGDGARLVVSLGAKDIGVLRLASSITPLESVVTTVADFSPEDFEETVTFTLAGELPSRPVSVRLLNVANKAPITHAEVLVLGDHSTLPPIRVESDGQGVVSLGLTNARRLVLYVRHPQLGEGEVILALTAEPPSQMDAHVHLGAE